jgi:hypothetical protein
VPSETPEFVLRAQAAAFPVIPAGRMLLLSPGTDFQKSRRPCISTASAVSQQMLSLDDQPETPERRRHAGIKRDPEGPEFRRDPRGALLIAGPARCPVEGTLRPSGSANLARCSSSAAFVATPPVGGVPRIVPRTTDGRVA